MTKSYSDLDQTSSATWWPGCCWPPAFAPATYGDGWPFWPFNKEDKPGKPDKISLLLERHDPDPDGPAAIRGFGGG